MLSMNNDLNSWHRAYFLLFQLLHKLSSFQFQETN
jgi:hypothetical protein